MRLNNPRSKFEITNMADDQVYLTPEDFRGASFSEEEIKKILWFYLFFTKARTGNVLWSEINFILIRFVLHVERERAYSGGQFRLLGD